MRLFPAGHQPSISWSRVSWLLLLLFLLLLFLLLKLVFFSVYVCALMHVLCLFFESYGNPLRLLITF